MTSEDRYTSSAYLAENPDWHACDSPWKAKQIMQALPSRVSSICEVGCGAGGILRALHDEMPATRFVGYDIAPDALRLAERLASERLQFLLRDAAHDPERFDLMLVIDVIEHVPDPMGFLAALRHKAGLAILHIPLDLSAQSVMRPGKLLELRRHAGHLHYFTPETARATVEDAGYRITASRLTRGFDRPQPSMKSRVAKFPRRVLPPNVVVRLLGGYSLLITAEPRAINPA